MPDHHDLDLDAAVSAELDGDLAGFAAASGLSEQEVREGLATPEAGERRELLIRARTELRVPPDPLDDVTRRRLLAGATTPTARPAPSPAAGSPWTARLAAAGVAVVLLAGGGIFLATRSSDDAAKSSGSSATAKQAPKGDLGDLGTLDQSKVNDLIGGPASRADATAPQARTPSSGAAGFDARSTPADGTGPTATATQVQACRDHYEKSGSVRFTAAGSYGGAPAVIVGIANGDRTIVFVVSASECTTVLYSASSTG